MKSNSAKKVQQISVKASRHVSRRRDKRSGNTGEFRLPEKPITRGRRNRG